MHIPKKISSSTHNSALLNNNKNLIIIVIIMTIVMRRRRKSEETNNEENEKKNRMYNMTKLKDLQIESRFCFLLRISYLWHIKTFWRRRLRN